MNFEQQILENVNSTFKGWDWPIRQQFATKVIKWVLNMRKFIEHHQELSDIVFSALGYERKAVKE